MRILHLVYSSSYEIGGVEVFSVDVMRALHERGVEQFVFCREQPHIFERLHQGGIPCEFMDFVRWKRWFNHRRVRNKIKSYAPDIVHCWQPRAAIYMPGNTGVPALGWFAISYDATKMKHYVTCDYYMGVSHEIADYIGRQTGHSDRTFVGHTFGTLAEDSPLSREEFGIPDGKPVILMLARMRTVKGVDVLLRAAVDLVDLDAFLLLVGDGAGMEKYQKLAQDLGIGSRVCFAGWRNDRSALLDLADVLAAPSRHEGCPAVMSEAWFKGVPLVASRAAGFREYIRHGENGMLSDIDDVDGLAKNLRTVLEDDALRSRLIAGGTHTYETQFSKEVVISNLIKSYEEIVRKGVIRNQ